MDKRSEEKAPLLPPDLSPHMGIRDPALFPQITGNSLNFQGGHSNHTPPFSYGVVDVTPAFNRTAVRNQKRVAGIGTGPLVAIISSVVILVLIISLVATNTGSGGAVSTQNLLEASGSMSNEEEISSRWSHIKNRFSGRGGKHGHQRGHVDIEIPQGRLRGYTKQSRDGRDYSAFFKVPYAEPPLGTLRFKDPIPPSPWEGLRDYPNVAPQCIQKDKNSATDQVAGEEDCLYANIYTPRLPQNKNDTGDLFPILVYIHGGGTTDGNGSRYGADYFMDEDVILITFQYRLGPFGFLSTGDDIIRGNMALKDQLEMLKWTRDNGKYFNGDASRVTIFGNSGGGLFIGYHMISPLATGLFDGAISQSSPCFKDFSTKDVNEVAGKGTMEEVGRAMGCDTSDSQKYWECLLDKDGADLALVHGEKVVYSIVTEDWDGVDEEKKFLPDKPLRMMETGRMNPVPYIVGMVNAETYGFAVTLLQNENATEFINDRFEELGPLLNTELDREEMGLVRDFYFGAERITNESFYELGDLMGDSQLVFCGYLKARYHARKADTYQYWLTKPPYKSYIDKTVPGFPAKELGIVSHADELQYFFLYEGYPEIPKNDPEYYEYSKYLVRLWANFARTGNPSMDGVEWTKMSEYGNGYANSTYWMDLADTPALTTIHQERMGFWDKFNLTKLKFDL